MSILLLTTTVEEFTSGSDKSIVVKNKRSHRETIGHSHQFSWRFNQGVFFIYEKEDEIGYRTEMGYRIIFLFREYLLVLCFLLPLRVKKITNTLLIIFLQLFNIQNSFFKYVDNQSVTKEKETIRFLLSLVSLTLVNFGTTFV